MRLIIQKNYDNLSRFAAQYIVNEINNFSPSSDRPYVLGLPTGSTPLGTYRELIRLYKLGEVSFTNVVSFNMDEYCGIERNHSQSYYTFMWDNFFSHIDIDPQNANLLDGNAVDLAAECQRYEDKIAFHGGIRLFLGGIGPDGHIAFNEPGSSLTSRTRVKTLTQDTIIANSRFFDNDLNKVPRTALTVGVGTIMDSDQVLILVNGHNKARALAHGVEHGVNHLWTISALQTHQHGIIVCDQDSTSQIKVGTYRYFEDIERLNIL